MIRSYKYENQEIFVSQYAQKAKQTLKKNVN